MNVAVALAIFALGIIAGVVALALVLTTRADRDRRGQWW